MTPRARSAWRTPSGTTCSRPSRPRSPCTSKSVSRIEALLFLHFVALLVHALIERDVRPALAAGAITELPLYPEDRDCNAPSTARILELFSPLQRHLLCRKGREAAAA